MVCSKFCLLKTKQKTPQFDAPEAYQYALPLNWKKYDGDLKMVQKYALSIQWEWYNELMTTHNSLIQDTGMESDVSYHDKDGFQGKIWFSNAMSYIFILFFKLCNFMLIIKVVDFHGHNSFYSEVFENIWVQETDISNVNFF